MKWYSEDDIDGLTTNGVFVMKPLGGFTPSGKPSVWREISVGGNVFSLRESRPMPHKSHQVSSIIFAICVGVSVQLTCFFHALCYCFNVTDFWSNKENLAITEIVCQVVKVLDKGVLGSNQCVRC